MLGPVGAERHRAPSPRAPRHRSARGKVRWPERRLLMFPSDAPRTGFDPPPSNFLLDIIGCSVWTPLSAPHRRGGRASRSEDPRADRGPHFPRVKSPKQVPAGTSGQSGHGARHPRFFLGPRSPRIRRCSELGASDIYSTCRHNAPSEATEDDEAEAVPQVKVRNRTLAEESPPFRLPPSSVHGRRSLCAGCDSRGPANGCEKVEPDPQGGQGRHHPRRTRPRQHTTSGGDERISADKMYNFPTTAFFVKQLSLKSA